MCRRGTSIEVMAAGRAEVKTMRKRYRVLILAVVAAAIAVPLGFALSLESNPTPARTVAARPQPPDVRGIGDINIVAASSTKRHLALVQTSVPSRSGLPALPDGAKLLFVGSALFGLAGVMRRTN